MGKPGLYHYWLTLILYIKISLHLYTLYLGVISCIIILYIKINEINKFIDEIEGISNIRKAFYKSIINYRYICIKDVYEIIIS